MGNLPGQPTFVTTSYGTDREWTVKVKLPSPYGVRKADCGKSSARKVQNGKQIGSSIPLREYIPSLLGAVFQTRSPGSGI